MVKDMYPLAWSRGRTVHIRKVAPAEAPLEVYSGVRSLRMLLGGTIMTLYNAVHGDHCEFDDILS